MLGYVTRDDAGASDTLLAEAAALMQARGWRLAGAVQRNVGRGRDGRCHMDLDVLGSGETIRISQDLGALATGCRLDPGGLERAVGLAEAALEAAPAPDMVVVNKFGRQEVEGRGFRPLIGRALARGLPVLVAVSPAMRDGFFAYSGDLACEVAPDAVAILNWADARRTVRTG